MIGCYDRTVYVLTPEYSRKSRLRTASASQLVAVIEPWTQDAMNIRGAEILPALIEFGPDFFILKWERGGGCIGDMGHKGEVMRCQSMYVAQ